MVRSDVSLQVKYVNNEVMSLWFKALFFQLVGIEDYLALGIPAEKLVLGLPWYGMKYPCLEIDEVSL